MKQKSLFLFHLTIFLGVTCPELVPPPYGTILCSATQQFESRCRVDCGACHKLVGSEERICRADGFWSGTDGVCQRKYLVPIYKKNGHF